MSSALKDHFGPAHVKRVADALGWPHATIDLAGLEMKARVRRLREALRAGLPAEYPRALARLLEAAELGRLEGFDLWPFSDFIQTHGLEHPELSLNALRRLTPRFSSEFAVRPFLIHHPRITLKFLAACARDPDPHVRRWASEGARPRLPWGERLAEFVRDPSLTAPLLERLRHDPELYVRKSVANHLNDVSKDHPERVVRELGRWAREAAKNEEHAERVRWITRHALRSLIKAGHPGALRLIGVASDARFALTDLRLARARYRIGDTLEFSCRLRSREPRPARFVVDYAIHYRKARGGSSPKVFKLRTLELEPGQEVELRKRHSLKDVSIRRHHPGEHVLALQVNGRPTGQRTWQLSGASARDKGAP